MTHLIEENKQVCCMVFSVFRRFLCFYLLCHFYCLHFKILGCNFSYFISLLVMSQVLLYNIIITDADFDGRCVKGICHIGKDVDASVSCCKYANKLIIIMEWIPFKVKTNDPTEG